MSTTITILISVFLFILLLIAVGIYLIAKKASRIADKATKQIIKETFVILKRQIDKRQNGKEDKEKV